MFVNFTCLTAIYNISIITIPIQKVKIEAKKSF
jgi:hypothetical protein